MGLSSPGIGSGLDVQGIVTSLVSAQITPVQNQHDQQVKLINTKISDLGQLKSSLSSLQTSLNNLANLSNLFPVKATASDSSFFSATTTSKATKGTYQVEVQNLAKQQSIASDYVSDVNTVGNGTLNIAIGQYTTDPVTHAVTFNPSSTAHITIAPGNESLTAIRDAINSSNAGVNANIVTDSLGSRLTLTSTQTGQKNAIQVTSTGGTFATSNVLKYDPTDTSHADGLTQKVAAEDSMVAINGLLIQDSSNQISGAITGVTLNLNKAQLGQITTLSLDADTTQFTSYVNDFVSKYNSSMSAISSLTSYNATTKSGGDYQGDSQIINIKNSLAQIITGQSMSQNSVYKTLYSIGIKTDNNGVLSVDSTKLSNALSSNPQDVGALFAKTATSSDNQTQVTAVGTTVPAGSYALALTAYTPGVSVSGTIGGLGATSSGTILQGTGKFVGLDINISGGGIGSRGTIKVTDGVAAQASAFLDTFLTASTGSLDSRTTSLQNQLKTLSTDQDRITSRQTSLQSMYLKQFSALDVTLTQLQGTSTYLTQQLSSLSKLK